MRFVSSHLSTIFCSILLFSFIQTHSFAASSLPTAQLNTSKLVVYWGGWQGMIYDLKNLPANVNVVNLAFADLDENNQIDTRISGWLTNVPKEDGSQLQPSYINWTQFKYQRPTTKIFLSLGGSTFSQIWTNKLTADKVDMIAKNIAAAVNQTYPVYRNNFATPADRLGDVTIDGIDLDVETGGARLSDLVSTNVVALIQSLKKYLAPNKMITFTGFSVGADPNNEQCTVPGSLHCGEDITIMTQSANLLDWVNVMAYDAGSEYATSKYQTAINNYAQYMGKDKTILGLDIQPQWSQNGPLQETAEQLAAKAKWQKEHQYGGAMFWAVNVSNNAALEQKYIEAIGAAVAN